MAFRKISVLLETNDAQLTGGMRRAASSVDDFGRRTTTAGKNVTRAGNEMTGSMTKLENVLQRVSGRALAAFAIRALGVYAAGRAVNQAFQAVVGGAVQFDTRMRNVNSISGLTETQLQGLGKQVLTLSTQLPQSANTLAEGLYDIASSGFQGAAGVTVLTAAAKAATAGLTDTATSAAAIAGVLNAYGKGADQARNVSDSLFQTVNLGVLSFADLAQGIGQVVGTAAAAGVKVDDLGQAIATMTKAGIVPAEAFTSANQLLAQLIQPGEQLAGVFKQLGYESGAAALKSKGLAGVMADIQRVTGGDITSLSGLFTDIRSLRGALALTANQGKLYRDVIGSWGAAHKGAGATATALAEQMKAVSAQWQLFKNRIQAAATEAGTRMLPALLGLMRGAQDLGHNVEGAVRPLAPTFHNIAEAIGSAVHIVGTLASAIAPLAKILAVVVAVPIVAMLNDLTAAVAGTLDWLDRHRIALLAIATVLTVAFIPAMTAAAVRLGWFTANLAAAGILRALGAITVLTGGVRALGAALFSTSVSAGAVLGGVFAGAAIIAAVSLYKLQQASQRAKDAVAEMTAGFDPQKIKAGIASLDQLSGAVQNATDHYNHLNRFQRGLGRFGFGPGAGDLAMIDAGTDAFNQQQDAMLNTLRNAIRLGDEFGVLGQTVLDYAAKNNIDLSKPWGQSAAAVEQVRVGLRALADQAGTSLPALAAMTDGNVEAMTALADAVSKVGDATKAAFSSASDVISQFKPDEAAKTVQTAQGRLLEAGRSLREEQARYDAEKKHSVSSDQQLAHARQDVTTATKDLAAAQADAAKSGDLSTIYRNNITAARSFVTNIDDALQRGLDPNEVVRLLQAGPATAGPLLDAIVSDHSNRLIDLSNTSEHALERISERAVRLAQFTARAVNAPLASAQRLAHELPKAFALDTLLQHMPSPATARWLEDKLGLGPKAVRQIATDFGITLPKFIQQTLDKHPVHVRAHVTVPGQDYHTSGNAEGGHIRGPGTSTSDSILSRLSDGEFVVKAKAVDFYGVNTFRALNTMQLPRFAEGGLAGSAPRLYGSVPAAVVRVVEKPATFVSRHEVNVGEVRAHDYNDFERQMRAKQRVRRAVGR